MSKNDINNESCECLIRKALASMTIEQIKQLIVEIEEKLRNDSVTKPSNSNAD